MSTFLDKNKKKTGLAALLLFIRARKGVTALLLLVVFASFLFVSPSRMLINLPGGTRIAAAVAWLAGKAGVDVSKWGLAGGKRDFGDLVAAFKAAKEGGGKAGWTAFMGGAAGAGSGTGSLGFVKGSRSDLETKGADKLPQPESMGGILNPDDARTRGSGDAVAIDEGEIGGGLVKTAFAGGFGGGLSGGAFASKGFFSGSQSASTSKLQDRVNANLAGTGAKPANGVQIQGAAKGQLSKGKAVVIGARMSKGMVGTHVINGQRAFAVLALGRGRAAISVAPNCTPGTGCPGEFAATNTGAIYDGNELAGDRTDILSVPEIDGLGSPTLPDSGLADQYVKDAEKMEADAKKCEEADKKWGPIEADLSAQQQALSDSFKSLGCDSMSCSKKNKSKLKRCAKWGDDMHAMCVKNAEARCAHMKECPLTAGNYCSPSECGNKKSGNQHIEQDNGCMDVLEEGQTCRPDRVIHSQTVD